MKPIEAMTRSDTIETLRNRLLQMVDEDHSMCEVAARHKIFCHGFRRMSEEELREKFDWISGPRPQFSREQLEQVINAYKLARQEALEVPLSCDAQMVDRDTCLGWDGFSEQHLETFCREILGREIRIVTEGGSAEDVHADAD